LFSQFPCGSRLPARPIEGVLPLSNGLAPTAETEWLFSVRPCDAFPYRWRDCRHAGPSFFLLPVFVVLGLDFPVAGLALFFC